MDNNQLKSKPSIIPASIKDYPTIQNMARFYVYDMSRGCGFISDDWACPPDGLYESFDFKCYFDDPSRRAFLIKMDNELAGFVLLNQIGKLPKTQWNMGEFFILAKFQNKGIGQQIAQQIWDMHPGLWEISVIPENKSALAFWRTAISTFTVGKYDEKMIDVDVDTPQKKRYIFSFDSAIDHEKNHRNDNHFKITFVDDISEDTKEKMTNNLVAYERSHGIDVNYKPFSVVISNEKNVIFGVLNAYTAFAEIYVDDIWVDQLYRDKGYGKKLLQALEEHFKGQGFNNINLVTSAFQAPAFYKKCGFTAEFTRKNSKNPKLNKTFFVKYFEENNQTQGLL